jgi:TonB family protein
MLAYVFLLGAATVDQADVDAKPALVQGEVTCWNGTHVPSVNDCAPKPVSLIGKAQTAQPRGNPGFWVSTADYPASALAAQQEGTTSFRLIIGPDGKPTECIITQSSGVAALDGATCSNAQRRARFTPALDSVGNPTIGSYSNRVTWRIPKTVSTISMGELESSFPRPPKLSNQVALRISDSDYPPLAKTERRQGQTGVIVKVNQNGIVMDCAVSSSSGHADLDAKTCALSKSWVYQAALDGEGAPVAGRSAHVVSWWLPEVRDPELATDTAKKEQLDKLFAEMLMSRSETMTFVIKADGSIADCKYEATGQPFGLIPKGTRCDIMTEMVAGAVRFHGKSDVDRIVTSENSLKIDPPFPPLPQKLEAPKAMDPTEPKSGK